MAFLLGLAAVCGVGWPFGGAPFSAFLRFPLARRAVLLGLRFLWGGGCFLFFLRFLRFSLGVDQKLEVTGTL